MGPINQPGKKAEGNLNPDVKASDEDEDKQKTNWREISKVGILIGKFLLILFILSLFIILSCNFIPFPYSVCTIGFEISLAAISVFSVLRMNTFKPAKKYDFSKLKIEDVQLKILLQNITHDVETYEEGSSFYFNGVRFYKYSTIILAGVSTVILGLDIGDNSTHKILANITYSTFSKDIALIIGAIITVSTSLMSYWNIEKYWLTNKTIANKLRALRMEVENDHARRELKPGSKELQEKFKKYVDIKGDFYKYWDGTLADRGSQHHQGTTK